MVEYMLVEKIKKGMCIFWFKIREILFQEVPVFYYCERDNVGDKLNEDLYFFYSNRKIINSPGMRFFKHFLSVGSVAEGMNRKSVVWGSGLISDVAVNNIKEIGDIRALRGKKTLEKLEHRFSCKLDVPLGDPALLLPRVYKGHKNKKYRFGVVLHYIDESLEINQLVESAGGKVINVATPVKDFVDELCSCECIISSSMHGLILADAYDVPNIRVVLGDKIIGGDFKFDDYYSMTTHPDESDRKFVFDKAFDLVDIENMIVKTSKKKYIANLDELERAFPLS